jgi:hypothetical protein
MLNKIDELADIKTDNFWLQATQRTAFICLILMALSAPMSIAATQTTWLIGMLAWVLSIILKIKHKDTTIKNLFKDFTKLDILLWLFFGWSVISSIFSYAPDISIDKLRGVSLFLIFYFVINNLRTTKALKLIVGTLIFSCFITTLWTPIERIFGRGIEIQQVSAESCLNKALLINGDTILKANGKKISSPEAFVAEIERNEINKVEFYRPDFNLVVEVKRADLLSGENALQKLGIGSWKHSRNWRSAGFYGHYTTFAEVLQLIGSLAFGLFIATFQISNFRFRISDFSLSRIVALSLFLFLGLMSLSLLLTVTRASQLAFLISAFVTVIFNGNRKILLTLTAIVLPIALLGTIYLQKTRNVSFFDKQDNSITWRQTVWNEGFDLATQNLRHLTVGVGMDSIKRYAKDWRLFDDGKLPIGHFHSTPLQLFIERGLPSLLLWLLILGVYCKELISNIKHQTSTIYKGILLGCLGGTLGFFISGIVHYNLGDAEVAMVFFLLMGIGLSVRKLSESRNAQV